MKTASTELLGKHLRELTEHIGIRLAGSENERLAVKYIDKVYRDCCVSSRIEEFPVWERVVEEEQLEIKMDGIWKAFPCSLLGSAPTTDGKYIEGDLCYFESAVDYQRQDLSYLKGKAVVHLGCHIEKEDDYRRLMLAEPAFLLFVDTRYPANTPLADGLFPSYVANCGAKPTVNVAYMDAWNWKKSGATIARLCVKGKQRRSFSQNVIAEIPGTQPESGIIYAGGHHDTQAGSVGADDNATGVVAMLELARILAGRQMKRTVRLISFGAEEQLSVGSAAYVRVHRQEIEKNGLFMFNMDSMGSIMGWAEINYNGDIVIEKMLKSYFERQNLYARFSSDICPYSDQFPFAAAGVPGLWIWRRNCEAGRFFHHRYDDTINILSIELIAQYINVAAAFIGDLADAEAIPFERKIPDEQAVKIKQDWESLFGGWKGF